MFAHQVIETFKDATSDFLPLKNSILTSIKNAQQFHFGDCDNIYDSISFDRTFEEEKNLKLPFKCCWFDYTCSRTKSKIAMLLLLHEKLNEILIFSFQYPAQDRNIWGISPVLIRLKLGEKTVSFNSIVPNDVYSKEALMNDPYVESMPDMWGGLLIMSLKLLTCKNISTENIEPSLKLNIKRIKNNKCPLFTYKVLVLKPTTKYEKSIPQHLWENRIHLCRGHFKEYTPEYPLFGKYTGRYWWQPQARGNKKLGVVMKDYVVKQAV